MYYLLCDKRIELNGVLNGALNGGIEWGIEWGIEQSSIEMEWNEIK